MMAKILGRSLGLLLLAAVISMVNGFVYAITAQSLGQSWTGIEVRVWVLLFVALHALEIWSLRQPEVTRDIQFLYTRMFGNLVLTLMAYAGIRLFTPPVVAVCIVAPFYIYWLIHNQMATLLSQNRLYAARDRYFEVMQRWFPRDVSLLAQQAASAMAQHRYEEAIQYAKQAIALKPELPTHQTYQAMFGGGNFKKPYDVLMVSYILLGNGPNALKNARICFGLHGDEDFSYIHRGTAFLLVEDFDAAAADLEHGLKITSWPSRRVIAEINLGLIDYALGNDDAALEHWSRALEIALPSDETGLYATEAHVCIGLMAFHRGDSFKAWHAYRTALKLNPQSVTARAGMAIIHAADDRWDLALKIWRRLVVEYPYFADPEDVTRRHFRWTPPMAEGVRQIVGRLNGTLIESSDQSQEEETPMRLIASHSRP